MTWTLGHLPYEGQSLAAWLGEPPPMSSLELLSPRSHLVVAGVVRRPAAILEELLGGIEDMLNRWRSQHRSD